MEQVLSSVHMHRILCDSEKQALTKGKYITTDFTWRRSLKSASLPAVNSHDDDGDLILPRRGSRDVVTLAICHAMATTIDNVGFQLWRGSFALADFAVENPLLFSDRTVLEIGAGAGCVTSLILATKVVGAKRVFCTDYRQDILDLADTNIQVNSSNHNVLAERIALRTLDLLHPESFFEQHSGDDVDGNRAYAWRRQDDIVDSLDVIVCGDCVYDDQLTDALLDFLVQVLSRRPCVDVYIAIEPRVNFMLDSMRATAPALDHFLARGEATPSLTLRKIWADSRRDGHEPVIIYHASPGDEERDIDQPG